MDHMVQQEEIKLNASIGKIYYNAMCWENEGRKCDSIR